MFRLLCLLLALGLVSGERDLQERDWRSYNFDERAELTCTNGDVYIAHIALHLSSTTGHCQMYAGLVNQITDSARRYCKSQGTSQRCDFTLDDFGPEPDPSCYAGFEVIYICK